jgi:ethanolamine utilization protein EutN
VLLGRVVGNVVATQKNARYDQARIMLVQPVNVDGSPRGGTIIALDSVDAGEGDLVLLVQEGWSASTSATGQPGAAIDTSIIGVVDEIKVDSDGQ